MFFVQVGGSKKDGGYPIEDEMLSSFLHPIGPFGSTFGSSQFSFSGTLNSYSRLQSHLNGISFHK